MAHQTTVILTRPREASARFAALLASALGGRAEILIAPIIEIVGEQGHADFSAYQTLIFTSQNAVAALEDTENLAGRRAYCVGDRTADAAHARGFQAVSAGGDAEALVSSLLADKPPAPWLHLAGEHRRGDVAARLSEAGHPTDVATIYRQTARPLDPAAVAAIKHGPVVLPLFSPRTAELVAGAMPMGAPPPAIVAISAAAADAWTGDVRTMVVADSPDAAAMVRAILKALENLESS